MMLSRIKKITEESSLVNSIETSILNNRYYYMGIAMILVILYHMVCQGMYTNALYPLKYGYIGVDVFLFFSALGCCFSISKSSISLFYKRRLIRIAPLFVIYAIFDSLFWIVYRDAHYNLWDWTCNITSLSFYGLGGTRRDWYLCFLILMYLILPLIVKCVKKTMYLSVFVSIILSAAIVYLLKPFWMYECSISRLPIVLMGIVFYFSIGRYREKMFFCVLLMTSLGATLLILHKQPYLTTTLLTPLLLVLLYFPKGLPFVKLEQMLTYVGSKSLEFYVANAFAMKSLIMIDNSTDATLGGGQFKVWDIRHNSDLFPVECFLCDNTHICQ